MSTAEKDAVFDRVYDALFRDVYAYFNVCFGAQTAEDLAQETFLRVWKAIDSGNIPEIWRAWVFRCAVNLKNDFLRKKYAEGKLPQTEIEPAPPRAPDDSGSLSVQRAFDRLPSDARELLTLKTAGLTSEEIGAILKISASAVRTRLQKAKQSFKISLETEGICDV